MAFISTELEMHRSYLTLFIIETAIWQTISTAIKTGHEAIIRYSDAFLRLRERPADSRCIL